MLLPADPDRASELYREIMGVARDLGADAPADGAEERGDVS